jgi:hypothetical protein
MDPLDRRLSGPQIRSGRCGGDKILDITETRTPTARSFRRYYTDCTTVASHFLEESEKNMENLSQNSRFVSPDMKRKQSIELPLR